MTINNEVVLSFNRNTEDNTIELDAEMSDREAVAPLLSALSAVREYFSLNDNAATTTVFLLLLEEATKKNTSALFKSGTFYMNIFVFVDKDTLKKLCQRIEKEARAIKEMKR